MNPFKTFQTTLLDSRAKRLLPGNVCRWAAILVVATAATPALALNLLWTGAGSTTAPTAGTWDNVTANQWNNGAGTSGNAAWTNANGAVFGGADGSYSIQIAFTLSLAKDRPPNVKVNSLCPGWVRTRMGGEGASFSPEEGAETAIWLATLPENGPNGGFFSDRSPIAW